MMTILLLIVAAVIAVITVKSLRMQLLSKPVYAYFKRSLPPMSTTEKEAMEAGDTWWEAELFQGKPNWKHLHQLPQPMLSDEEQAFIDNQLATLMAMLNDHDIVDKRHDLPPEVWAYLKKERFFSLIIPKEYGGLKFSAHANSTIVSIIASKSLSAAVTVMVPNSLGPGELLTHYGTEAQKQRWLPALAVGDEVPCFALTGPEAGSDAGAIPDEGEVCYGQHDGQEVLGIKLSWNKRYITLAPVATVLGLAFKLRDPQGLLGEQTQLGITCALIPTSHPGVEIGERHDPLGLAFMNGPTRGQDVFIPLDWVIGGADYVGKGWRMLVECLSAGRGISLPALGTATGHLAARMTGAYGYVRRQFGMPIGKFDGIQAPMAAIGANAYVLDACRQLTNTALMQGFSPSVVTAISKYHMTEMGRQSIEAAMDIHAGRGIQLGPMNYLGNHYKGMPIAITVEGANILTRSLMIFGQGATRCHPYVFDEMEAAADSDQERGLARFDQLLLKHMGYTAGNFLRTLAYGLTGARLAAKPVAGDTAHYYQQLARMSSALAFTADIAMLVLGGALKRKELISARLGDVLSELYIASAILKRFEGEGRQQSDLPLVHFGVQRSLQRMGAAFDAFYQNFAPRPLAWLLKLITFPLGIRYRAPDDQLIASVCTLMMTPGVARERMSYLCHCGDELDNTGLMDAAFNAMFSAQKLEQLLVRAQAQGELPKRVPLEQLIDAAESQGILSAEQAKTLRDADRLRSAAIQVDSFAAQREAKPVRKRKPKSKPSETV